MGPITGTSIYGRRALWEVELDDISIKLQSSKNKSLSRSGCKFLVKIPPDGVRAGVEDNSTSSR